MLLGAFLGSKRGAMAVAMYLLQASIGLPVLAGGAILASFATPKFGYLLGMGMQAALFGFLAKTFRFSFSGLIFSGVVASALQMACGVLWLSFFIGIENALAMGLFPFILSEGLKIGTVATVLSAWRKT